MTPEINVCICSYKRPQLLQRLLTSLAAQETAGEFTFTIIVADNDAHRSAEPVVREFTANGLKLTYNVEPEQNISLARNKSISMATGDYVATIDDDDYADRQWLLNLYRAIITYGADVVHGPVVWEFPAETPDYIRVGYSGNRPNPTTGSTGRHIFRTGNSLFKRKLIEHQAAPFDPRFGRTGSGDHAFFWQLKKRGCRMIWCREALVFGSVPRERARLLWMLKRRFRSGLMRPRVRNFPDSLRGQKIRGAFGKILKQGCAAGFYLACAIFKRKLLAEGVTHLIKVAFNLGILAHYANYHYEEYRAKD